MYLGMLQMLLGVAIFTGSIMHYGAAIAFFIIMEHTFCSFEEARLRAEFGPTFDAYRSAVRR